MDLAQWLTIVITKPDEVPDEAAKITALLDEGAADLVHIRKPDWSSTQVASLLADIPARLHPRLRLHDRHTLLRLFTGIGGIHLTSRNPVPERGAKCVSASLHSLRELGKAGIYDYVTLSPVFDSISKPGYSSAFNLGAMPEVLRGKRVIALSGVKPEHFRALKQAGFRGAALLGYVWDNYPQSLVTLRKHTALARNFALQFITNGATCTDTVWQARQALQGGCRWIQVRMKEAAPQDVELAAAALLPLCRAVGATLLVDDHVEIARRLGIGVHLGKGDMPASQARGILGPDAIIGSTCNSAADLEHIFAEGASDYVGLGPFRFTTTKKRLAPTLGAEGYRELLIGKQLHALPVVAIGGITAEDIAPVMQAGADGVAVSGAITRNADPAEATTAMINEINKTI